MIGRVASRAGTYSQAVELEVLLSNDDPATEECLGDRKREGLRRSVIPSDGVHVEISMMTRSRDVSLVGLDPLASSLRVDQTWALLERVWPSRLEAQVDCEEPVLTCS